MVTKQNIKQLHKKDDSSDTKLTRSEDEIYWSEVKKRKVDVRLWKNKNNWVRCIGDYSKSKEELVQILFD